VVHIAKKVDAYTGQPGLNGDLPPASIVAIRLRILLQ
jgi:hypothetical protein